MNICRKLASLVAGALALFATVALADDAPAGCKLVRLANWHVRFIGTHPVVDGSVNGKKIGVLIDTGASLSLLTKAAADRLELPTRSTGQVMSGVGGGTTRVLLTHLDELRISGFSAKGLRVRVAGEQPLYGMDFVLGQDVLQNVDIELDYANSAIRLYQAIDCKDKVLSYWDADAQQLPLHHGYQDLMPILVNGQKAEAMLDSGGGATIVQLAYAEKLGITPASPGVRPAGCTFGLGDGMYREWVARFDTVSIGGEIIRNARLLIGPISSEFAYYRSLNAPDVLLGGDFLRTHHVLISHSQGRVYVSYAGGQVFPTSAAMDCEDERVSGKSPREAIAIYDELLAKNPSDVNTLLYRSRLRYIDNDFKGALADLDAILRIEPVNPVALDMRSRVRFVQQDYPGALADSDAAMDNGMRSPGAYMFRANIRHRMGDSAGMLAEMDEALKIDPHNVGVLRARGRIHYFQEEYAAAEADFNAALAERSNGFDSIWLYLIGTRGGAGRGDALDKGLAQLGKEEWPAPIIQYLLDRIDNEALMKIASAEGKEKKGRECEARFYAAERWVIAGRNDEARPLLEAARDGCPKNYVEYEASIAELDRLSKPRKPGGGF